MTTLIADRMIEAATAKLRWPQLVSFDRKLGPRSMATCGFNQKSNAKRAAEIWCKRQRIENPREGHDYKLVKQDKTWAWHPPSVLPPHPLPPRKPGSNASTQVAAPVEPAPKPQEPDVVQVSAPAVIDREPTREQRLAIRDILDCQYDVEAQRYFKDGSDAKFSEQLKLPRIWIARMRTEMYGDFDRNEAGDERGRKLDEAIRMADAAVERLVAMAAEAEKISNDLKSARQRLA